MGNIYKSALKESSQFMEYDLGPEVRESLVMPKSNPPPRKDVGLKLTCGRRVDFSLRLKMLKSPIDHFKWTEKNHSSGRKDCTYEVAYDAVVSDFNSGQFKR